MMMVIKVWRRRGVMVMIVIKVWMRRRRRRGVMIVMRI